GPPRRRQAGTGRGAKNGGHGQRLDQDEPAEAGDDRASFRSPAGSRYRAIEARPEIRAVHESDSEQRQEQRELRREPPPVRRAEERGDGTDLGQDGVGAAGEQDGGADEPERGEAADGDPPPAPPGG